MITEAIKLLAEKRDLNFHQAEASVYEMMDGTVSAARTAAFLTAMSIKGETPEEIAGAASGMRAHALPVQYGGDLLEIVGTGGDGSQSFNISTTSAFVAAAGGVKVSKHGNRAASSKCGAADVLEALGAEIEQGPAEAARLLDTVGMCFFYAPLYHKAMKYVGPVRRELGIRTIFNILGPLTNPARAAYDCIGVYDESLVEPIARVLDRLGVARALVFYGRDGMDEISPSAETKVCELDRGALRTYVIRPEDCGLARGRKADLTGGGAQENAAITEAVLAGRRDGVYATRRNAVLLNAGAAFYVTGRAETLRAGVEMAARLIDGGRALSLMHEFVRASRTLAAREAV